MKRKRAAAIAAMMAALLASLVVAPPNSLCRAASADTLPQAGSMPANYRYWVCPMHPEIVQDHPGTCPICGMKLVSKQAAEMHEHGIRVDSSTVQRLGVRLARVGHGVIGQGVQTYANVVAAEDANYAVQSKYEGWIRKLRVHAVGERVRAGQVLYEIYSPELITRQRTYLSSIERRKQLLQTIPTTADTENDYVMEMAMDAANDRARLHNEEGVSVEDILDIERSKQAKDVVRIVAPRSGVVTRIDVKEGSLVMAATVLMTLSDTSRVWLDIPLYPDQAGLVGVGDPLTVMLDGGRTLEARVDFVSPLAEGNKVLARAYLDNRRRQLRPGSFASVTIRTQPHEALLLPRSAIIYGAQGKRVMLSRGDGHFLPVPVQTGAEEGDQVELLDGLREGAEVAVNGQFLLDAAASLSAAAGRLGTQ